MYSTLPFITNTSLHEAAVMESLTAKGLRLEYMITGEITTARTNKNPVGPSSGLYQLPFAQLLSPSESLPHT